MKLAANMMQGACMAIADSVPGVSGGTIAFILGFYDKFIMSLNNLVSGTRSERKDALNFLMKLMAGWVIGFGGSVLLLGSIFESHMYELCSLFLGLSIFALPIVIKEEKENLRGRYQNGVFAIIGIATVVLITYFNPTAGGSG